MKGFFSMFTESAKEFTKLRTLTVTAMLVALSMLIELFAVDVGVVRLNFAFIAIASIGMLFGPCVGLTAGLACDVVGHIAHPVGAFLPAYTLVAGLQGLIYGVFLYHKMNGHSLCLVNNTTGKQKDLTMIIRMIGARLTDVIVVNLLLNTALNLHYGFIPEEAYGAAVVTRVAKNVIELVVDLPLLFVVLPGVLLAYKRVFSAASARRAAS